MTNQQILDLYLWIAGMRDTALPVNVTYSFLRNKQILEPAATAIENCRLDIIRKYGEQDGDHYTVPADKVPDFQKELGDFLAIINDDIKLHKIKLSDLPDTSISIASLEALMPMIGEEE